MSISGGSNRISLDLNVHKVLATAATAATAAATVSQELWNLGRALFQRAQEPNIPCGESLTSICVIPFVATLVWAWVAFAPQSKNSDTNKFLFVAVYNSHTANSMFSQRYK